MLSIVLLAALAQGSTPPSSAARLGVDPAALADRPISVLLTRRVGLGGQDAIETADHIAQALAYDGLAVVLEPSAAQERLAKSALGDSARCEGRVGCIAGLAKLLGAPRVIGLELGQVADEIAIHLVALDLTSGKPRELVSDSLVVEPGASDLASAVLPFATRLARALVPNAAIAKKPLALTPSGAPPSAAEHAITYRPGPIPRYAAVGGTAVLAGLTAYFLISANQLASKLNDSRTQSGSGASASTLSQAEAESTVSSQHRDVALGIGGAVLTAGLGAFTAWLWTRPPRPEAAR